MELNDAARRIVGQHWRIVAAFVVAGMLAGAALAQGPDMYTASTRLVLGTGDPETRAESTVIADTVRAIATSRAQVRDALREAGVTGRDSAKVAKHHVSVSALGASAVVELSVSDRSPGVAASIANALAARVIETRRVSSSRAQETLASLDRRIAALDREILRADGAMQEALVRERGVAESERVTLLTAAALRPKPLVISRARPPERADPSSFVADALLGALLGLILGLGVAGLIEIVRPTLVGGDVLAADLGTSHLGTLATGSGEDSADVGRIAMRLTLGARAARVENVSLLAPRAGVDLERLADQLESSLSRGALDGTGAVAPPARRRTRSVAGSSRRGTRKEPAQTSLGVHPFRVDSSSAAEGPTGLALVVPTAITRADLLDAKDLVRATGLPLIGVIAVKPARATLGLSDLVRRFRPATAGQVERAVEPDTELRAVQEPAVERPEVAESPAARAESLEPVAEDPERVTENLGPARVPKVPQRVAESPERSLWGPTGVAEDEPGSVGAGH